MIWEEVVDDLLAYIAEEPELSYKLIIGTDSQVREETYFVTAVVVHRVGKEPAITGAKCMKTSEPTAADLYGGSHQSGDCQQADSGPAKGHLKRS